MGFTLAGSALSKLVLAHDRNNNDLEDLVEEWQERSEAEISNGLRWFYCCGLAISLICMGELLASGGDCGVLN